jgi:hypothetical protein
VHPLLAAVLGSLLTFIVQRSLAIGHTRRRRRSVATAMLAELEALDLILHQVEEFRHSSPFLEVFPRMAVTERVADYVDVLRPDALRAVISLNVVVAAERVNMRELDKGLAALEKMFQQESHRMNALDEHERVIQHKAIALLERTAHVREVLIANGGRRIEVPRLPAPEPLRLP